jgi:hypothetical protein
MSFWTSQDKIPVKQTKVAIQVENGLDFKSRQTLHFHIPPNVGFMQPKETYLRFDVKILDEGLTKKTKLMLDKMGAQVLIRDITIRSGGAGGVVLEEIQNYNVLTALRYSYEQNQSIRNKRCLTEGAQQHNEKSASTMHNTMSDTNNLTENAYFNCFTSTTDEQTTAHASKKVKCLLPLHTGIFQNDKVFPVMLTEGLRVEILLEDAPRCIIPLSQVSDNCHLNEKVIFHSLTGHDDGQGTGANAWDAAGGPVSSFFVRRDNSQGSAATFPFAVGEAFDLVDMSQNQSEGTTGNTNAQAAVIGTDAAMVISAIEHYPYNAAATGTTEGGFWGLTKITLQTGVTRSLATYNNRVMGGNTPAEAIWVMVSRSLKNSTTSEINSIDYEISDVEMIIQQLEMPSGYVSKLMSMMKSGGALNYDFLSYRNYKYSAVKSDTQVNMRLPLVESRAKSILCIPTDASVLTRQALISGTPQTHDSTLASMAGTQWAEYTIAEAEKYGYNHNNERIYSDKTDHGGTAAFAFVPNYSQRTGLVGIADNLTNYQLFYDGKLNPSRKVECAAVSSGRSLEQQWAIESEKALAMGGIRPLSFRDLHENWFIGRALSLQDGVYDARNKDFNLQLAYEGASTTDPNTNKAPTRNKLWNNYCAHIRRMVVRGNQISLEV